MNRNKNERTCRLGLRVSPKEKEQIDGIARSCGISTAEYLRKRALGYAVKAAPPDAFYLFVRHMSRLLNQVPSAKVAPYNKIRYSIFRNMLFNRLRQSRQNFL